MIHHGHCLDVLKGIPDNTFHVCVTSPPYWSLRDYGVPSTVWGGDPSCSHDWESAGSVEGYAGKKKWQHSVNGRGEVNGHHLSNQLSMNGRGEPMVSRKRKDNPEAWTQVEQGKFCTRCDAWLGCLGLEPTPDLYVDHIVMVFEEVRRVLRPDGTLWLNLGDCYAAGGRGGDTGGKSGLEGSKRHQEESKLATRRMLDPSFRRDRAIVGNVKHIAAPGLKPKDLVGIPWRVAFALQASGWYLRSDIIWSKVNPMPESTKDRPTKSHEYVFLLAKSESYFFDADAIREGVAGTAHSRGTGLNPKAKNSLAPGKTRVGLNNRVKQNASFARSVSGLVTSRNRRSVWNIPTAPFKGAHFATFPKRLVRICLLAGTSEHGCCPKCGKQFVRMVHMGEERREQKLLGGCNVDGQYHGTAQKQYAGTGAQDPSAVKKRILEGMRERITVGWRPTCRCGGMRIRRNAYSSRNVRAWYRERWQQRIDSRWSTLFSVGVQRPIALDPFHGSGTTGVVCDDLRVEYVGIELNKDYINLRQPAPAIVEASA